MPNYFFHVFDDYASTDKEGIWCEGPGEAMQEAIRLAGEILQEVGARFPDGSPWRMEVHDDAGSLIFTLLLNLIAN